MNYEEKYKEALENLRKIKEENKDNNELVEFIECKFPELKESKAEWVEKIRKELKDYLGKRPLKKLSESDAVNQWIYWIEKQSEQKPALSEDDERIRKDVISFVKQAINAGYGIIDKEREEKWISWLENQSKLEDRGNQDKQHLYNIIAALWDLLDKIDTFSDLQIDDTRPHNPFRKIEDITQERHKFVESDGYGLFIEGEKITDFKQQSEQKSNKTEPKFKVGDWIINNLAVWYIESIHNGLYDLKGPNGGFMKNINPKIIDNNDFHIWTIQDAEEGDVLASKHGDDILIFRNLDTRTSFLSHFNIAGKGDFGWANDCFIPATKEQRDLLFQEMKKEGYEWDVDKKELKEIEQKSTNIEPKFKICDWIVHDMSDGRKVIRQIIGMTNKSYILDCEDFNTFYFNDLENDYHLWTIQDAKDGDVLVESNCNAIIMFRGVGNIKWDDVIDYHCYYNCHLEDFIVQEGGSHWGNTEDCTLSPATKEQRELLFAKMKESCYEWDDDKKELKKIEQKPTWSEEDEKILQNLINETEKTLFNIKQEERHDIMSGLSEIYSNRLRWLKSIKDRF